VAGKPPIAPTSGFEIRVNTVAKSPLTLEAHSGLLALAAGRTDRYGHPQGDNDIAEQYNNPKELALLRARKAAPVVRE
jgi:hypothetical protein